MVHKRNPPAKKRNRQQIVRHLLARSILVLFLDSVFELTMKKMIWCGEKRNAPYGDIKGKALGQLAGLAIPCRPPFAAEDSGSHVLMLVGSVLNTQAMY